MPEIKKTAETLCGNLERLKEDPKEEEVLRLGLIDHATFIV